MGFFEYVGAEKVLIALPNLLKMTYTILTSLIHRQLENAFDNDTVRF